MKKLYDILNEDDRFTNTQPQTILHLGDFHYAGLSKTPGIAQNQILGHVAVFAFKYFLHVAGVPGQYPTEQGHIHLAGCDGLYKPKELDSQLGDLSSLDEPDSPLKAWLKDSKERLKVAILALKKQKDPAAQLPEIVTDLLSVAAEKISISIIPGNHESYAKGVSAASQKSLKVFYDAVAAANTTLQNHRPHHLYQVTTDESDESKNGGAAADVPESFCIQALKSGEIFQKDDTRVFVMDSTWQENFFDPNQHTALGQYLLQCQEDGRKPIFALHHPPAGPSQSVGRRGMNKYAETSVRKGCSGPKHIGDSLLAATRFDSKYLIEPQEGLDGLNRQIALAPQSMAALLPHHFQVMLQKAIAALRDEESNAVKSFLHNKGISVVAAHQHALDYIEHRVFLDSDASDEVGVRVDIHTVQTAGLITKHLHEGQFTIHASTENPSALQDPRGLSYSIAPGNEVYLNQPTGSPLEPFDFFAANIELFKIGFKLNPQLKANLIQTYCLLLHTKKFLYPSFVTPNQALSIRTFILSMGAPERDGVAIDALYLKAASDNKIMKLLSLLRAVASNDGLWEEFYELLNTNSNREAQTSSTPLRSTDLPELSGIFKEAFRKAKADLTTPLFLGKHSRSALVLMGLPADRLLKLFLAFYQLHIIIQWTCDMNSPSGSCPVTTFNITNATTIAPLAGIVNNTYYQDQLVTPAGVISMITTLMMLGSLVGLSSGSVFRLDEQKSRKKKPLSLAFFIIDALISSSLPTLRTAFMYSYLGAVMNLETSEEFVNLWVVGCVVHSAIRALELAFAGPDMRDQNEGKTLHHYLQTHRVGKNCGYRLALLYPFAFEQSLRQAAYNATLSSLTLGFWIGVEPSARFLGIELGIAVVLSGVMSVMSMIPKVQTQLMADSLGRASTHLLEIALLFSMIPSLMSQLIDPAAYQVEVSKNPNYFAGASVCSVIALMLIAQHIYGCSNKRPVLKDAPTAAQEAARLAKKTKNCCSRLCASKKPQTADNDNELRRASLLTQ